MIQRAYFKSLTGVRAVAAYMVFLHHIPGLSDFKQKGLIALFYNELYIGVTVFFVLSGFLITFRYWDKIKLTTFSLKPYLVNRLARIFPAYFIITCCSFVFIFHNQGVNSESVESLLLNVTLLRGFSEEYRFSGVAQGWSLTVEETFYFSAPFLFYFIRKLGLRYYMVILAGYVLLSLAIGAALTALLHGQWLGFFENYSFLFLATFFGRSFEFAVGAGLAFLLLKRQQAAGSRQQTEIIASSKSGPSYFTYSGLIGILLVVFGLMFVKTEYNVLVGVDHPLGLIFNNIVLPFFIATLFYGLLFERNFIVRMLSQPVTELLGKSSYSFYLLHMGFITTEIGMRISINSPIRVLALFCFLVVLSICFYYLIEEPVNKKIRSIYDYYSAKKNLLIIPQ